MRATASSMPGFKQILAIALPQMGLMLCHLGISMTDLWVAGRINSAVQASLGVVSQIFMVLMLVTSIAASGSLAAISQALGAGLARRAGRYAGLVVTLGFVAGTCSGLVGYVLLPVFLRVLHVPEHMTAIVSTFVSVYCLQLPFYYALIMLNSIFRAYKRAVLPFISFLIVLAANCVGSLGFGLGYFGLPEIGYAGVAWSTFGATLLGLACSIRAVFRHGIISSGSFAPWRWVRRAWPYLFRVGGPAAAGQLVEQSGSMAILTMVARLPEGAVTVLAGMTLGMRIEMAVLFPLGAVGLTLSIFSGHLLGGGEHGVLYRLGNRALVVCVSAFSVVALGLFLFREPLAAFMSGDREAIACAVFFLAFGCASIPLRACSTVFYSLFAGAGATALPCLVGCVTMWGIRVPLAYVLACRLGWAEAGIFTAMLASGMVDTALMAALYASGTWLEHGMKKRHKKTGAARGHAPAKSLARRAEQPQGHAHA